MKDVTDKKDATGKKDEKVVKREKEKIACTPQVVTGKLSAEQKLKVGMGGDKKSLIEITAPEGKILEYTVLVTGRLIDAPKKSSK